MLAVIAMMGSLGPGNGQWVRAHNEASAQSFVDERGSDWATLRQAHERRREILARMGSWLARLFRR